MEIHPIEGLMKSAMDSIQNMVDVNTIIGEPIETSNNMVIIPISKVSFGFAAGGSEFKGETIDEYKKRDKEEQIQYRLPFGGGSGATVSITPVAFVVVSQDSIKLMPVEHASTIDKLLDYVPDLMERTTSIVTKVINTKNVSKENEEFFAKTNSENYLKNEENFDNVNRNANRNIDENVNKNVDKNANRNIDENANRNVDRNANRNVDGNANKNVERNDNVNGNVNRNVDKISNRNEDNTSYDSINNERNKANSQNVAGKNYSASKPVGSVSRVIPKEVEIEYDETNKLEEYLEDE
jgi:sporulation protein YtfJ